MFVTAEAPCTLNSQLLGHPARTQAVGGDQSLLQGRDDLKTTVSSIRSRASFEGFFKGE